MPQRNSPGTREERVVALWARLLHDGYETGAWVPARLIRNAVVATTKVSSMSGVRDHLRIAEDFGLIERERRGNAWVVKLKPLGAPGQFVPRYDNDLLARLVETGA